jgi:hypothetical protein
MTKQPLPKEIGETLKLGKLTVLKVRAGVYSARVEGTMRSRWGNAEQIRHDIRHYQNFGTLPRSNFNWS